MTTMAVAAIAVTVGALSHTGLGSLSAIGVGSIAAICPVGYLETEFASRNFTPYLFIGFLVIAGLTVLFGRFFCGWVCPVPLVRKVLTNKINEGEASLKDGSFAGDVVLPVDSEEDSQKNSATGLVILGVTLGSSAICGFPVFCLICPVGLSLTTIVALIRLITYNDPSFDLLIFPAVIIIELVLVKKWCRNFCPIGALLSLFSRFNRTLVPTVDRSRCLETISDVKCQRCRNVCSFDIELKNGNGTGEISDCSKCRECSDNCPVHAIRFPWR